MKDEEESIANIQHGMSNGQVKKSSSRSLSRSSSNREDGIDMDRDEDRDKDRDEDGGEKKRARGKKIAVWDRAGMLERMMGDEALAETIIEGFLTDIPRQIEALRGYLEAGDAAGVERQAHTIKGAAGSIGGEVLRALAFELEQAGKAGDLERMNARMGELAISFAALKACIQKSGVRMNTDPGGSPCAS